MKRRQRRIIIGGGILLLLAAIVIILTEHIFDVEPTEGSPVIEERPPAVQVFKVRRGPIRKWKLGEGIAHPVRREFLNFGQAGKVAQIAPDIDGGTLREGSVVHGPKPGQQFGQLLAQLDTRELTANVEILQAELEQTRYNVLVAEAAVSQTEADHQLAKANLDRVTRLNEAGTTISLHEQELAQAQQAEAVAHAAVVQAESDLRLAKAGLEQARQMREQGITLTTYQEELAQAEQEVSSAEAELVQAENDYQLAGKNFEKSRLLHDQGILSQMEFEQKRTNYSNAQAALATAKAELRSARSTLKGARNDLAKAKIDVPITETEQARASHQSAKAALETARANLEAAKSTVKSAIVRLDRAKINVPVVEYEQTRAGLLSAEAALKNARANVQAVKSQVKVVESRLRQAQLALEQASIFAPFDGVIASLTLKTGEYVSAFSMDKSSEQALLESTHIIVSDPSEYEITLKLPAYIAHQITPGMPAFITEVGASFLDESEQLLNEPAGNGAELSVENEEEQNTYRSSILAGGQVYSVSPLISPGGRAIQVKVRTTEGAEHLQDGMLVVCGIIVEEKSNALLIPLNSLMYRNNQPHAFVMNPVTGVVERRELNTGFESARFIEVLDGISEQEFVVTTGRHRLVDGGKAEIANGKGGL